MGCPSFYLGDLIIPHDFAVASSGNKKTSTPQGAKVLTPRYHPYSSRIEQYRLGPSLTLDAGNVSNYTGTGRFPFTEEAPRRVHRRHLLTRTSRQLSLRQPDDYYSSSRLFLIFSDNKKIPSHLSRNFLKYFHKFCECKLAFDFGK
jgi:hypothetical protein